MKFGPRLLARYIIGAAVPYILLSLALLTAVLFAQQAGRFAEIALFAQVPASLLGQIAAALLPGVLVFTIPAAVLAGIIIGYSRMGSDSEIVAMRAAGVGTWSLLWPVLVIGIVGSAAALYIHMYEAPQAARDIRKAAIQGALRKLDSPVEPRTFTTEIPGFILYVREGNKANGTWGRVFIYRQEPNGSIAIVTARSGRIDSSEAKSELVLNDTVRTTLPGENKSEPNSYVVERSEQLRIAINTGRSALLDRLNKDEAGPEELGWSELVARAYVGSAKEQNEKQRSLHRRLALSFSPFLFAVLGGAIGIRVKRGGRGLGILLSLLVVVIYYLMALLGESLARVGTVSPAVGLWMASVLLASVTIVLLLMPRLPRQLLPSIKTGDRSAKPDQIVAARRRRERDLGAVRSGFPSLLDLSLFRTLSISFLFGFLALISIFIIFTLFEMWRFIGSNQIGMGVVARYLLFLLPLVSVEVFPATMLIAVLITYALLARRREAIAWWASGQSVYRLMVPGLLFAVFAGAGIWIIQEQLMPYANVRQDALRAQIRGGEARAMTGTGKQWLASTESSRIYSYDFVDHNVALDEPVVYEFDPEAVHLVNVIKARTATWSANDQLAMNDVETISLRGLEVAQQSSAQAQVVGVEPPQIFRPTIDKPSQLSASGLRTYVKAAKRRGAEVSSLALALQRKYATPFGSLVMAVIGIPLALSFGRKGAVLALCAAVGVSVAYLGLGGGFQQLGNYGLLPPAVAAWSPAVIFLAAGTYFLSRLRT
jgi:LPS export ABC transporter permease LptG/LPS export ABC transporter permease LptF